MTIFWYVVLLHIENNINKQCQLLFICMYLWHNMDPVHQDNEQKKMFVRRFIQNGYHDSTSFFLVYSGSNGP